MDEKTIKETLLKGERVTLECKKAKAEVPKSIWRTLSAKLREHHIQVTPGYYFADMMQLKSLTGDKRYISVYTHASVEAQSPCG